MKELWSVGSVKKTKQDGEDLVSSKLWKLLLLHLGLKEQGQGVFTGSLWELYPWGREHPMAQDSNYYQTKVCQRGR